MTYKTKNTTFVIAFAALLMVMPLAGSNAFADSGTSSMNLECGVTTPVTIPFGTFSLGTSPAQQTFTAMDKLGGEIGSFIVTATDWVGVAQEASSAVTVLSPVLDTDVITIDGITYTATTATQDADNFIADPTDDSVSATNLATAINLNTDAGTVTTDDVDATATGNTVLLVSDLAGTDGNAIVLSQTTGTGTLVVSNSPFENGEEAGVVHMQAEVTKYTVTVDGSSSSGDAYAAKTALAIASQPKTLAAQTEATTDLQMSLEILTDDTTLELLPYNGALTQTLTFTSVCNAS